MTYFRAESTIIGPECLTAVFGMGTGVTTSGMITGIRMKSQSQFGGFEVTSTTRTFSRCDPSEKEKSVVKRSAVSIG